MSRVNESTKGGYNDPQPSFYGLSTFCMPFQNKWLSIDIGSQLLRDYSRTKPAQILEHHPPCFLLASLCSGPIVPEDRISSSFGFSLLLLLVAVVVVVEVVVASSSGSGSLLLMKLVVGLGLMEVVVGGRREDLIL